MKTAFVVLLFVLLMVCLATFSYVVCSFVCRIPARKTTSKRPEFKTAASSDPPVFQVTPSLQARSELFELYRLYCSTEQTCRTLCSLQGKDYPCEPMTRDQFYTKYRDTDPKVLELQLGQILLFQSRKAAPFS